MTENQTNGVLDRSTDLTDRREVLVDAYQLSPHLEVVSHLIQVDNCNPITFFYFILTINFKRGLILRGDPTQNLPFLSGVTGPEQLLVIAELFVDDQLFRHQNLYA